MTTSDHEIVSIVFVETASDIRIFDFIDETQATVAVAFSPVIHAKLEKNGHRVVLVDQFFKEKEHGSFAKISESLLQHVIAGIPHFPDKSLKDLLKDDLIYQAGKFINQLVCYELILKRIMDEYPNATIFCCASKGSLSLNISYDERVLGRIVPRMCTEHNRSFRVITLSESYSRSRRSSFRFARFGRILALLQVEIARLFFRKTKNTFGFFTRL